MKAAKVALLILAVVSGAMSRLFFPENIWLKGFLWICLLGLAGLHLYWPLLRPAKTDEESISLWLRLSAFAFFTSVLTIGIANAGFIPPTANDTLGIAAMASWVSAVAASLVTAWRKEDKTHK